MGIAGYGRESAGNSLFSEAAQLARQAAYAKIEDERKEQERRHRRLARLKSVSPAFVDAIKANNQSVLARLYGALEAAT